jgi:hypothetical protein
VRGGPDNLTTAQVKAFRRRAAPSEWLLGRRTVASVAANPMEGKKHCTAAGKYGARELTLLKSSCDRCFAATVGQAQMVLNSVI